MLRRSLTVTLGLVSVILWSLAASAATLVVTDDGTGDFPTIQAALDAAANGDVIELADGIFTGDGNRDVDFLGKAVTVRSQSGDPMTVEIRPGFAEPLRAFTFVSGEGPDTVVENVRVHAGGEWSGPGYGGAILCDGSGPTIRGCIFEECQAPRGGALFAENGAFPTFIDCEFTEGLAGSGGAAYIDFGSNVTFDGCLFAGNWSTLSSAGLYFDHGSSGTLSRCTVASNRATVQTGGIGVYDSHVTIERSIIWGNCGGAQITAGAGGDVLVDCSIVAPGINTTGSGVVTLVDVIAEDPQFCDPASCSDAPTNAGVYTVAATSPATPSNSPCGELIGARDFECSPPTPLTIQSWSEVKARYAD